MNRRLAELLVESGIVARRDAEAGLREARRSGRSLANVLLHGGRLPARFVSIARRLELLLARQPRCFQLSELLLASGELSTVELRRLQDLRRANGGSFAEAIKRALRQDPDIILVGEMRDLETIEAAITAAETGHLVFGTLHTNSAAKTVDRIVDAFPANMKEMIRTQLASSLVAVISQVLCKKIGGGRIAGYEIMINTTSISAMIRENKTFRITSDIQTGGNLGMITMDAHLLSLVNRQLVTPDEALEKAQDPIGMREKLTQMGANLKSL